MRKFAIVSFLVLMVAAAQAGVIADIQQGVYTEGDMVTVENAVVVVARYNGAYITELPVGPYAGIWVYTNDGSLLPGDIVTVTGEYKEYYDLSEIDASTYVIGASWAVTSTGPIVDPFSVTAAEVLGDPEAYEGVSICITDGMIGTVAASTYGEWSVEVLASGEAIVMDDYWFDDTTVVVGQCYDHACGIWDYGYGAYKLQPFADGIDVVECAVPATETNFSAVKGLFK